MDSAGLDSPAPLQRLTKRGMSPTPLNSNAAYRPSRSPSPSPVKRPANAFDLLGRAAKSERPKVKLGKSEFIEAEAQESDDDEMLGFGFRKKDDGEEEEGEDLDKPLEALVDDQEMDEETAAAQLVMEKFKSVNPP